MGLSPSAVNDGGEQLFTGDAILGSAGYNCRMGNVREVKTIEQRRVGREEPTRPSGIRPAARVSTPDAVAAAVQGLRAADLLVDLGAEEMGRSLDMVSKRADPIGAFLEVYYAGGPRDGTGFGPRRGARRRAQDWAVLVPPVGWNVMHVVQALGAAVGALHNLEVSDDKGGPCGLVLEGAVEPVVGDGEDVEVRQVVASANRLLARFRERRRLLPLTLLGKVEMYVGITLSKAMVLYGAEKLEVYSASELLQFAHW